MLYDTTVACPYCGEQFETLIDHADFDQEYYEDCAVCCRPILFHVAGGDSADNVTIDVKRDDE